MSRSLVLYKRRGYGLAVVALAAALFGWLHTQLPADPVAAVRDAPAYKWPDAARVKAGYFAAIARPVEPDAALTPPSHHLRLSGTFMTYDQVDNENRKPVRTIKALLDDLKERTTQVVGVGEHFSGCLVKQIHPDSIVLEREMEMFTLYVASGSVVPGSAAQVPSDPATAHPATFESMPALLTSRFGKKIGENRWVLRREALLDYYDEVKNDAERLTLLWKSFTTNRDAQTGEPLGFNVNPAGEPDFWTAMGLQDGDIMRKVNSMNMINQRRGEFMLNEFFQHKLSAVVLDVVREGKEEKLIYIIR
jgi:hypothetical protein